MTLIVVFNNPKGPGKRFIIIYAIFYSVFVLDFTPVTNAPRENAELMIFK